MPKSARTQVINIPKLLEPPDLPTLLKTSKPVIETEDFKLFADPGTIALIIEATAAIAGFYKAVSGAKTADALKNIEKQLQKISEQLAAIDQKLNRILYEIAKLGVKIDEGFVNAARVLLLARMQTIADNYTAWVKDGRQGRSLARSELLELQSLKNALIIYSLAHYHLIAHALGFEADLMVLARVDKS